MKKKRGKAEGAFELPESGLAEDILAAYEARETSPLSPLLSPSPQPGEGDASQAVLPVAGPERLYAFVDRLERRGQEAEEKKEEPETWVTFELAEEIYALPVSRVQEVLRVTGVTRVPHAPAPIRGITNLRGRVLAVVDLRVRLGLKAAELTPQSRIVVVTSRERSIGLLVDAARQVVKLLPSGMQPPPADVMTERSDFIRGVYHKEEVLLVLLDVDRVLWIHEGLDLEAEAS
ncbi:MAG TPA: chemotaxis protein CheW [Thermoanaerobaculia bacterium]|nr:chemotaxis protein CheW [Thermoanaerobaculia bacterium]